MTESSAPQKRACEPIHRITPHAVRCGALAGSFQTGANAVVLSGDERIPSLFRSILDWLGFEDSSGAECFGTNLIDLARNHLEDNANAGDMLRFQPGVFGHLARKFIVFRNGPDQPLRAFPNSFYVNNRRVLVPYEIIEKAWGLVSEVLMSAMPQEVERSDYAAEVDILVYPTSSGDINGLTTLLADSCGAWSRLGHRIDANKGQAAGLFDKKVAREFFAIASLIPGLKDLVTRLNDIAVANDTASPRDYRIVGGPHIDKSKFVTGLIGNRHNLQTQIFSGKRWIPVPVNADTITMFPGLKIGPLTKIPATRHRILMERPLDDEANSSERNITLSLAVVSRPKNLPEDASIAAAELS